MKFFRDLACIFLGGSLAFLFCEGALRLAGTKYEASFFTPEAERAFASRPGAEGWQTSEGESYVRINSAGLYDREHTIARPANTIRIALLGSSETEAKQVQPSESFAGLLEQNLNRKLAGTGRQVETLNFGVAGYNLPQIYLTLHNHVWQYDPQIVLLFYSNYLVLRNTAELSPEGLDKSRFMILRDGKLEPDEGSRVSMARQPDPRRLRLRSRMADVMNVSRVLSLLNYALINVQRNYKSWKSSFLPTPASQVTAPESRLPSDYLEWWPFLSPEDSTPPVDQRLVQSSAIGDAIIRQMYQETGQHHSEFRLIIIDLGLQLHPDKAQQAEFMKRHGISSLDRAQRRLLEFCAREGIPAEALVPSIEPAIPPGVAIRGFPGHPVGTGHYNLAGHKLLGDYFTEMLLRNSPLLRQMAP